MAGSEMKTHKSAVVIIPPEEMGAHSEDPSPLRPSVPPLDAAYHVDLSLPAQKRARASRRGTVQRDHRPSNLRAALVHDSKLTVNDPNPEASHRPILYDSGRPSSVIWFRTVHATTDSATRPPRDRARSRSPRIDVYRKNAFSTRAWSW